MEIVVLAKLQIACLVLCGFIGVLYLSSERQNTRLYKSFGRILLALPAYLASDIVTVYTVNRTSEDSLFNSVAHRIFFIMLIVTVFLFCNHMNDLIEVEEGKTSHRKIIRIIAAVTFAVATFYSIIASPAYAHSIISNYAKPSFACGAYGAVGVYIVIIISLLIRHWKAIPRKTRLTITVALTIETIGLYFQVVHTDMLLSGFILTFMMLAFYITLENPDAILLAQVEEEKNKADMANRSKSQFVSVVSHEIRTPMNAIVGMTDIMLRDADSLNEEQKKYLKNMQNSGAALVMIVNDILDMSKLESGKMELVESVYDIREIVADVKTMIDSLILDKPVEVITSVGPDVPKYLMGDALRIRQIMINLLNNALKYTNKGYIKLEVTVEQKEPGRVLLHFSFKDSGIGIRKEDLQKLGEAFVQVDTQTNHNQEGTGLGLSISKRFVDMMGGKLQAASDFGKGSEFWFSIWQAVGNELMDTSDKVNIWGAAIPEFTAEEARILIVDDNQLNLMVAKGLLEPLKMQIDTAESGHKAIDMIVENVYDIVFMDYVMPHFDGVATTMEIRRMAEMAGTDAMAEYLDDLTIIALSGDVTDEVRKKFIDAGIDDFVEKPMDMKKVKRKLYKWLPKEMINIVE